MTTSRSILAALFLTASALSQTNNGPQSNLSLTNDTVTGTSINHLAVRSPGGTAIQAGLQDANRILGLVVSGAGKSSSAQIARTGVHDCDFDGPTTAGDYVIPSPTHLGLCHDTGSSAYPSAAVSIVGKVVTTGANRVTLLLATPEQSSSPAPYRPNLVTDFHADNTGVTFTQTQIQTAIDTVAARGGGQLFWPCGLYSITSSPNQPAFHNYGINVSLIGASKNCVTLAYQGTGRAFDWYASPFTVLPYGELSGFQLVGNPAAQIGIYTGQMDGVFLHDFSVTGFTKGIGIQVVGDGSNPSADNKPPIGSFSERLMFQNVTTGNNLTSWDFKNINGNTANSFAYSDYIGLHCNADEGQRCVYIEPGTYFGFNHFSITCNITAYNAGTVGPVCFENAGQMHLNPQLDIVGEYDKGQGRGTPYAFLNDATGTMDSLSCNINVAYASILNKNPGNPVRCGKGQSSFDQGTYAINGYPSQVDVNWLAEDNGNLGVMGGNLGVIHNTNGLVGSAFAAISGLPGNKFMVCESTTAFGNISACKNILEVDGDTHVTSAAGPLANNNITISDTASLTATQSGQYLVAKSTSGLRGFYQITLTDPAHTRRCDMLLFISASASDPHGLLSVIQNSCQGGINALVEPQIWMNKTLTTAYLVVTRPEAVSQTLTVSAYGQDAEYVAVEPFATEGKTNVTQYQQYLGTGGFTARPLGFGTNSIGTNVGIENALGHYGSRGPAPVIEGKGCTASGVINDNDGVIALSAGATTCIVKFANNFNNPVPQLTASSPSITPTASITKSALTIAVAAASGKVYYHVADVN